LHVVLGHETPRPGSRRPGRPPDYYRPAGTHHRVVHGVGPGQPLREPRLRQHSMGLVGAGKSTCCRSATNGQSCFST
jgi:hypothetical protein